jgi:tetrahydromethanopterin S-methyltransferase subunit G
MLILLLEAEGDGKPEAIIDSWDAAAVAERTDDVEKKLLA